MTQQSMISVTAFFHKFDKVVYQPKDVVDIAYSNHHVNSITDCIYIKGRDRQQELMDTKIL
jgi:hypothetical protein